MKEEPQIIMVWKTGLKLHRRFCLWGRKKGVLSKRASANYLPWKKNQTQNEGKYKVR